MKVLVVSDTHNDIGGVLEIIDKEPKIDHIIHLGDHVEDAEDLKSIYPNIPIDYVRGNTDYSDYQIEESKMLELCGKKIWITHGHLYYVKTSYRALIKYGEQCKADIILFGHTHIPLLEKSGNMYVMNPGSTSGTRSCHGCTYGMLELEEGKDIKAHLLEKNK